jgi:hypothetical protein
MDNPIEDMLNKGLAEIDNAKYSRQKLSVSPTMIAWKFLDGNFADFQMWKSSAMLTDIELSKN